MQYKDSDYDIYEDGSCYSHKSHKFLTPQFSNKYPTYNLTLPQGKRKVYVHRMVAETFLEHDENKNIVNHKDGNTKNFHISNLEWVTSAENSLHASKMGLRPKSNQNAIFYDGEEWVAVIGYKNYIISSCGRVMNKNTKRLLKPTLGNTGYYEVQLWQNNKGTTQQIHKIEYDSFYEKETGKVIKHKDGNKLNNNLNNLERVTYQENNLHAVYVINTNNCAIQVEQIDKDGNLINIFPSISQATKITGINNISRAITSNRTAGGYFWKKHNNN